MPKFFSSRVFHLVCLGAALLLAVLSEMTVPGSAVHIMWAPFAIGLLVSAKPLWGSVMASDVFGKATMQWIGFALTVIGGGATTYLTKSGTVAGAIGLALLTQLRVLFPPALPPLPPSGQAGA